MPPGAAMILAPVVPAETQASWNPDPLIVVPLAAAALLYLRGVADHGSLHLARRRVAAFYVGLVALAAALASPVDELAEQLFSWHMIQHLLLVLCAAPAIVYGRPVLAFLLALPAGARRGVHRAGSHPVVRGTVAFATHPVSVWLAFAGVLWGWHLPGPYQAALRHEAVHAVEHAMFLGAALGFWGVVIGAGTRRRTGYAPALVFVFTTMLHGGWLAMVMTFVETPLYPLYAGRSAHAIADQQLAGVLMWVPMGAVLMVTLAVLFLRFFSDLERRMWRLEHEDVVASGAGGSGR